MPSTRNNWNSSSSKRSTSWNRGRNSRSTSFGGYGSGYGSYSSNYNTTNNSSTSTTTNSYSPSQFRSTQNILNAKITSFKTINQQCSGSTKVTAFSPTGANKWINFVNDGAFVYKFNNTQFSKFFGSNWNNPTPSAATRFLQRKFGTGIKAVTRGRNNTWLVAATPKVTARPFSSYSF